MAESEAGVGRLDAGIAGQGGAIEPSTQNALLHFQPLVVFPLIICAAMYGGWWIAGPILYVVLVESLDRAFGEEERNMDPDKMSAGRLFLYDLTLWFWAILWPVSLAYALWQILVVGHLAAWEIALIAVALINVGQAVFIIGHEMVHRQAAWERWLGEFLLASSSYPHYATEHVYVHHAFACTPMDAGTAPKGVSFWRLIPRDLKCSLTEAWRFAHHRLSRRRLPVWHYTNPFWRYFLDLAIWYGLVYWMGGPWALLVFIALGFSMVLSMKIINYVQHYGLQRIRLPNGRYEKVQPWHSWTASSRFTNWMFYNMQRHSDHHIEATRHYPLLQHYGEDQSPKLPGNYLQMAGLALFPRRWAETMDPLVDSWREKFYPQIDDWRAYESRAYAAYPDAFEAISEILDTSPLLAGWINHSPELLENLLDREFTDLDLPDGFGPDSEFERVARSGLARLYWTREFGVAEMKEQIGEIPYQGIREAVETARHWSNDKTFQVGMHTIRGSLSPTEAGAALSNIAEASMAVLLSAVEKVLWSRRAWQAKGGVAVVVSGELADGKVFPGAELHPMIVFDSGGSRGSTGMHSEGACGRFFEALQALSRGSLLFSSSSNGGKGKAIRSLDAFKDYHRTAGSSGELLELARTRCIFETDNSGMGGQFAEARQETLAHGIARDALIERLREAPKSAVEPDSISIDGMRGGGQDVERAARLLQLTHIKDIPDIAAPDAVSIFRAADAAGLISADAAKRLVDAAEMWRNLSGILQLTVEEGLTAERATPEAKAMIAYSCGMEDYDELTVVIRETASRAAIEIDTLMA